MKSQFCLLSLWLAASLPTGAALYQSGPLAGTTIPDNNTLGTGNTLSFLFNQSDSVITGVSLSFALQGGFSTDLSGYLRLGNTESSPSYNLTTLIQSQSLSPSSATSYTIGFTTSGFQTTFNELNPNGNWTLFFADSSGGGNTTLNGWSLDISAIPEPTTWALLAFGALFGGTSAFRWWRSRTAR